MVFKKRAAKKEEARNVQIRRRMLEADLAAAVTQSEKIADPAARIIQLENIYSDIHKVVREERIAISNQGLKAGNVAGIGASATGAAIAVGLAPVTAGFSLIAAFPGALSGLVFGVSRGNKLEKKLRADIAGHWEALQAQQTRIDEIVTQTIENNVKEISTSPVYEKMMAIPHVSEQFALVAAKFIAQEQAKAAEEAAKKEKKAAKPKAPDASEAPAPKVKQRHDFTRIKKLGEGAIHKKPAGPKNPKA